LGRGLGGGDPSTGRNNMQHDSTPETCFSSEENSSTIETLLGGQHPTEVPATPVSQRKNGDLAFDTPAAIPAEGNATNEAVANATKTSSSKTLFAPASRKAAEAAKKGTTSTSRTGKAKQVSYEFRKPPKGIYVKVHPSPNYHTHHLPVFVNENEGTYHYINPALYESGELPGRFQNACKLMDIHTTGCADGTFILWHVYVSASRWRKAAVKAVDAARNEYVIVSSIKARQTYLVEATDQLIPEPKWSSLPSFDQMLIDAFDSTIHVADDKVVLDYMLGGVAVREDEEDSE
jgi:hypothetical protein